MQTVTVSEKGQVVIPVQIRRKLGIAAGCQLDFSLEGHVMRVEVRRRVDPSSLDDGFGLLTCSKPGPRRLADFDAAQLMRQGDA